ncbi:formimidoylglutamase [Aurantibacillus circumpalustris]|uniref:formimidoylglutamase n=1 Tax=Aurantibacillus circumpalustris TaxID=3036359 RepID=UPI00295ABD61|nr:formimidoylglutamase [Aurantibacillus circumpalustris]
MIKHIKPCTREEIEKITRRRSTEEKIGDKVSTVKGDWQEDLKKSSARFVVFGIAEDIGVRANYGREGAATAFIPALDSFLSQQSNSFLDGSSVFILGEVVVDDLMDSALNLKKKDKQDMSKLRELVSEIDARVVDVMRFLIDLNKIPIIIGGGHNNAYGNIKGCSQALGKKINVINCDPHLDFRPLEGRHSGNGFSYAYEEGYVNKYAVVAMHEQYNNTFALNKFKEHTSDLFYNTYESIFVREDLDFKIALKQCIGFVKNEVCGLEIDLDAITNVPSSAKTSSGISPIQARQYIHESALNLNTLYFHIAEGAPVLSHIKADNKTGKLIAYLMADYIKAVETKNLSVI